MQIWAGVAVSQQGTQDSSYVSWLAAWLCSHGLGRQGCTWFTFSRRQGAYLSHDLPAGSAG